MCVPWNIVTGTIHKKSKVAFIKISKIFKSHNLKLDIKVRLLSCYVFSIYIMEWDPGHWSDTNETLSFWDVDYKNNHKAV
jgi:hypothetical protein